jgi:hypothetical protein
VPLGGKKLYMLNLVIVFTFVAVWHDTGNILKHNAVSDTLIICVADLDDAQFYAIFSY